MKTNEPLTKVLFRADRTKAAEVTAVFPAIAGTNNPGTMTCYAHVGQHGCCESGWLRTTRPAKLAEYMPLQKELENMGYRLQIAKRCTSKDYEARKAQIAR